MKSGIIYCEGNADSFDYAILNKVIDGLTNAPRIHPLGGKKGAGGFIDIHLKQTQSIDFYLFFRDYDFDFEDFRKVGSVLHPQLHIIPKKDTEGNIIGRWCVSYRTTIENYLYNPNVFAKFLNQNGSTIKHQITSEEDAKRFFGEVAKELAAYQAVRHTMGKMRLPTDFGTTFTKGSGSLPEKLDPDFCKEKAILKIHNEKNKTLQWTEEKFEQIFNEFYTRFSTSQFYDQMEYFVWYQAKDFQKRINQKIEGFKDKRYYEFAIKHFDYTQFPDLVELRNLIENEIN